MGVNINTNQFTTGPEASCLGGPLEIFCGGLEIATNTPYFVIGFDWNPVTMGDLPPYFSTGLTIDTNTKPANMADWALGGGCPTPSKGAWDGSTVYEIGDSVSLGSVITADNVYMSLIPANLGFAPDNYDGTWTNLCTPTFVVDQPNTFFYGYVLGAYPDGSTLGTMSWTGSLTHSLFWDVTPPGDQLTLAGNGFTLGGGMSLMFVESVLVTYPFTGERCLATNRSFATPRHSTVVTGTQGIIVNPGINATFETWHTSGLSYPTYMTLDSWTGVIPPQIYPKVYNPYVYFKGGTGPFSVNITAGTLPAGMTMTPDGIVTGVPSGGGAFNYTVQVEDAKGHVASVECGGELTCPPDGLKRSNRFQ